MRGFPAAKLTVPGERLRIIRRDALLGRLDGEFPLTLVAAPAGYGKSTLVAAWLREGAHGRRVAWLSLDESDVDGARFMRGIVAALQRSLPAIGANALLAQTGLAPPAPSAVMALVCEELERHCDAPIVLVLDDYHLGETEALNVAIECLLEQMPRSMRLVLVSRRLPRLPLERWRTQQRLLQLDASDLRFSTAETATFLRHAMELDLADGAIATLEARTDGWAAGLQMAALSLRRAAAGTPEALAARFHGCHRLVADYLASEVLEAQPPEVRRFLAVTSALGHFNRSLCDAVTGAGNATEMLRRIEEDHLFLVPLDDDRGWFRYHPLFADFLVAQLSASELRATHARASAWYESEHQIDEAIRHARLACDAGLLVRLFRLHFEELMCRGEVRTLIDVLAAIPDSVVLSNGDLASLKAWLLYLTGKTVEARKYELATRSEPEASASSDPTTRGRTKTLQTYFALNWGDPASAPTLANDALRLLDDDSPYFRVLAMSYLGQAQSVLNQRAAAVQTLRQALYLGESVGNAPKALDALLHLVPLLNGQGRVLEGIELCERAVARYRDALGSPVPFAAPAHIGLGQLLYEIDDLASARAHLEVAESLSAGMGMLWFHLMSLCWLAKIRYAAGDTQLAWRTAARARELVECSDGPRRRRVVELVTCELSLREGDLDAAARVLNDKASGDEVWESEGLFQARLLLARRRPEEALVLLDRLRRVATRDGFEGDRVRVLVLSALAHATAGKSQSAQTALAQALTLASPRRLRRAFVDAGPALLPLLDRVRHVAPEFVAELSPLENPIVQGRVPHLLDPLTPREITLLQLLNRGLQNKEIAASLSLTVGTTKQYMNRLFSKLGARNRVEALVAGRGLHVLS